MLALEAPIRRHSASYPGIGRQTTMVAHAGQPHRAADANRTGLCHGGPPPGDQVSRADCAERAPAICNRPGVLRSEFPRRSLPAVPTASGPSADPRKAGDPAASKGDRVVGPGEEKSVVRNVRRAGRRPGVHPGRCARGRCGSHAPTRGPCARWCGGCGTSAGSCSSRLRLDSWSVLVLTTQLKREISLLSNDSSVNRDTYLRYFGKSGRLAK